MSKLNLSAYYYSFDETGSLIVDEILSAVARAGKAYHSTEYWSRPLEKGDISERDKIQQAANNAANKIREASRKSCQGRP